jgi:hypothetical protein
MQPTTQSYIPFVPDGVNITELAKLALKEIRQYRQGNFSSDEACVRLLRLATKQYDSPAWEALESCFEETLLDWIQRHPKRGEIRRMHKDEHYCARAFAEFRRLALEQAMEFTTLAATLRYLFVCLNKVLLDALRTATRPAPPQEMLFNTEKNTTNEALQEIMVRHFPGAREQRLAYLLFHCGLAPKEIVRTCPNEFSDLQEIYAMRQAMMIHLLEQEEQQEKVPVVRQE